MCHSMAGLSSDSQAMSRTSHAVNINADMIHLAVNVMMIVRPGQFPSRHSVQYLDCHHR